MLKRATAAAAAAVASPNLAGGVSGIRSLSSAIGSAMGKSVSSFPARNVLRVNHQNIRWSASELKQHSDAVANGLLSLGCSNSTVVSILPANAEHVALQLATSSTGIKLVDVEGSPTAADLAKILADSGARVAVTNDLDTMYEAIPELATRNISDGTPLSLSAFPQLKYIVQTGREPQVGLHRFRDVVMYYADPVKFTNRQADVGTPVLVTVDEKGSKVAEYTQKDIETASNQISSSIELPSNESICLTSTKNTSAALALGSYACMINCTQFVVPSEQFDKEAVASTLEIEQIGAAIGDSASSVGIKSSWSI